MWLPTGGGTATDAQAAAQLFKICCQSRAGWPCTIAMGIVIAIAIATMLFTLIISSQSPLSI